MKQIGDARNEADCTDCLAAYAMFKNMYNVGSGNDIYVILSKFIESIILDNNLHSFSANEMRADLKSKYSFDLNLAIIKTAIKKIDNVCMENHEYVVKGPHSSSSNSVYEKHKSLSNEYELIFVELEQYAKKHKNDINLVELKDAFIKYFLEEKIDATFSTLISGYILEKERDSKFQAMLQDIQSGIILYSALRYNVNIFPKHKWKNKLCIFLEMEILFHLAGLNGEIYEKMAGDLIELIKEINQKAKRTVIELYYFTDISKEVNDYFGTAENIVKWKARSSKFVIKKAMRSICNGCQTASDVLERKVNFWNCIEKLGIKEYNYEFYDPGNYSHNLEDIASSEDNDDDRLRYKRHISYINILRNGKTFDDITNTGYILLTETRKILELSKLESNLAPMAVTMNMMINRIWYDLGKGFNIDEIPRSFQILAKAKILLSSLIDDSLIKVYRKALKSLKAKTISPDEMENFIFEFRRYSKFPEEINGKNVAESIFVISNGDYEAYVEKTRNLESLKTKNTQLQCQLDERDVALEKNCQFLETEIVAKRNKLHKMNIRFRKIRHGLMYVVFVLCLFCTIFFKMKYDSLIDEFSVLGSIVSGVNIFITLFCKKKPKIYFLFKRKINIVISAITCCAKKIILRFNNITIKELKSKIKHLKKMKKLSRKESI